LLLHWRLWAGVSGLVVGYPIRGHGVGRQQCSTITSGAPMSSLNPPTETWRTAAPHHPQHGHDDARWASGRGEREWWWMGCGLNGWLDGWLLAAKKLLLILTTTYHHHTPTHPLITGWYDIASLEDINQREDGPGLVESKRWARAEGGDGRGRALSSFNHRSRVRPASASIP